MAFSTHRKIFYVFVFKYAAHFFLFAAIWDLQIESFASLFCRAANIAMVSFGFLRSTQDCLFSARLALRFASRLATLLLQARNVNKKKVG